MHEFAAFLSAENVLRTGDYRRTIANTSNGIESYPELAEEIGLRGESNIFCPVNQFFVDSYDFVCLVVWNSDKNSKK